MTYKKFLVKFKKINRIKVSDIFLLKKKITTKQTSLNNTEIKFLPNDSVA